MSYQDHSPRRMLDLARLPAQPPGHNDSRRRSWGAIIAFAATFTFILAITLGGLGLPSPPNLPAQTSDQR